MAKDSDPLAGVFDTKESGLFSRLLAEESEFDRRTLWRLGSWGLAAIAAVVVAVMTNQAQISWRHDEVAAAALARQADRLQALTKDSQNETRRLASAIETLNADRDRLYSRVTLLEQGLDSVTGAIAKQGASAAAPQTPAKPSNAEPPAASAAPQAPPSPAPAPNVAPVASTPSPPGDKPRTEAAKEQPTPPPQSAAAASLVASAQPAPVQAAPLPPIPLVASKSIMAPPDPAASKLVQPEQPAKPQTESDPPAQVAAAPAAKDGEAATEEETPAPSITVQQTRFAVDLGSANSIDGLRAMWRGLIKSNPEIASLRPIIMIKEKTGPGMQLRLGAGPLVNAAAAAKFCAALVENGRACETTVFDGQRLSMRGDAASPQAEAPAAAAKPDGKLDGKLEAKPENKPEGKAEKPQHRRWSSSKRSKHEEPAPQPPPPQAQTPAKPESTSALSSFFRRN